MADQYKSRTERRRQQSKNQKEAKWRFFGQTYPVIIGDCWSRHVGGRDWNVRLLH